MSSFAQTYDTIRIETPENISFDYELAGPGSRIGAYLIDYLIQNIVAGGLAFIVLAIGASYSSLFDLMLGISIAIVAIFQVLGGYFFLFEFFNNGQTPGKKALGIRVIQANGTAVRLVPSILRNILRLIDCFLPFQYAIGVLALVFSKNVQRFGDMFADTIVIKESKRKKAPQFRWKPKSRWTNKGVKLNLNREEFDFLNEYVNVYKNLSLTDRSRISGKIVKEITERHQLGSNPYFSPLIEKLAEEPDATRYKQAEQVMKEILSSYLNSDEK